ncbi:UDP-N-acetylmuramate--L-alanine ligase [Fulvivirgaceae bacterium BMA12]|uniref:UDP-N-acetylmuramate--L-alanine ligase n=1 Tax=Agaribacillus aureus TaxID=3051825 RepID=A0ABT8L1E6_9BACT|nr:UDP-N-acetylmuramate--L-alanine ligase [Fulvivirgaceae bacterium BMA12]
MNLKNIHIAYFIGIGGIGMSALARWFNHNNVVVKGYDKTSTKLTAQLITEGMEIHFEDDISLLPEELNTFNHNALVVYTPAIPEDHRELNFLKNLGYEPKKRSEVLGIITENKFTVAVAGTHGKTTTSSMIAHLLKVAALNCSAFLGGITVNYKSNLLLNENTDEENIVVVEADEYDRSFLTLHPDIAVITSADADHLDIYDNKANMFDSFKAFIGKIANDGRLFINESIADNLLEDVRTNVSIDRYAYNGNHTFANNIRILDGDFVFDFSCPDGQIKDLRLQFPGYHNLENAIAAISVARYLGVDEAHIRNGIETYAGVNRRFEYIVKNDKFVFIDDYAHHPTEITAFIQSVKAIFPGKKLTVIFQPHLYSRTRDFAEDFAESLSLADEVFLMDIYPAREEPIEGVTADLIFDGLAVKSKARCNKKDVLDKIKAVDLEVLATIGAGDIDQLIDPLKQLLKVDYDVE